MSPDVTLSTAGFWLSITPQAAKELRSEIRITLVVDTSSVRTALRFLASTFQKCIFFTEEESYD